MMATLVIGTTTMVACSSGDDNKTEKPGPEKPGPEEPEDPDPDFNLDDFECLTGSDYHVIALCGPVFDALKAANKITVDFRTDDLNQFLYIWENTYGPGVTSGPNMFGLIEGWSCLQVAVGSTWSGAGFISYNKANLDKLPETALNASEYTLHIAMKSQDQAVHTLNFYSGAPDAAFGIKLGYEGYTDPEGKPAYNFKRDGEWHEIYVPMTAFTDQGLIFQADKWANATVGDPTAVPPIAGTNGHNVIALLSGASGIVNIDATFIYKKK